MKNLILMTILLTAGLFITEATSAQGLLKKLKDKTNEIADKAINKKVNEAVGIEDNNNSNANGNNTTGQSTGSRSGRPANTTGEGLKNTTAPDVALQIDEADKAYTAANYNEARYSIQQALLGVELQIGRQILKDLPSTVAGLPKDTLEDRVTSTRWGLNNLAVQRVYQKDDKQLEVTIGNSPLYTGLSQLYWGGMATYSTGDNQNAKQIKVKGNNAVIKFDPNDGYTVLIQLGQSSGIAIQGTNFNNEQEIMSAVNSFDIDKIKKLLGEK